MESEFKNSYFKLNKKEFLEYQINLKSNEDVLQVINLIPNHLEFPEEKLDYFKNLDKLDLTVSFCFLELEKIKDL